MGNIGKKSISFRVGHLTITAEAEYYGKNCADRGECQLVIPEIIRKPNSLSVLLFVQNISKLLTRLPPRRLSSILWPIFRHGFRI